MPKNHFIATHTFVSEEAKADFFEMCKGMSSEEFMEGSRNENAILIQHWMGSSDFFFCHWIAESEDQIYQQLEEWGLQDLLNTLIHPMYRFMSAYRNSDELDQFPQTGDRW